MAAKNDVTNDEIKTKSSNKNFRDGWDLIWGAEPKPSNLKETKNEDSISRNPERD